MTDTTATASLTRYQLLLVDHVPRPIRNDREYRRALRQIERLMKPHPTKEERDLIEILATLIEQYESAEHPVPRNQPREMLAHYLENRGVSRAEFARATGIPRSTITNVLAGRRGISRANALRLAEYFRVSASLFLSDDRP